MPAGDYRPMNLRGSHSLLLYSRTAAYPVAVSPCRLVALSPSLVQLVQRLHQFPQTHLHREPTIDYFPTLARPEPPLPPQPPQPLPQRSPARAPAHLVCHLGLPPWPWLCWRDHRPRQKDLKQPTETPQYALPHANCSEGSPLLPTTAGLSVVTPVPFMKGKHSSFARTWPLRRSAQSRLCGSIHSLQRPTLWVCPRCRRRSFAQSRSRIRPSCQA